MRQLLDPRYLWHFSKLDDNTWSNEEIELPSEAAVVDNAMRKICLEKLKFYVIIIQA